MAKNSLESSASGKSALAVYIKTFRDIRGYDQRQLESPGPNGELGFPKQFFHKLETGKSLKIDDGLFEKLSVLTGLPVARLRQMRSEPAAADQILNGGREIADNRIRMAFGHVIWAAPFVVLAAEDKLPQMRFTSLRSNSGERSLSWVDELDRKKENKFEFGKKSEGRFPDVPAVRSSNSRQSEQNTDNRDPLSAADVLKLLENGDVELAAVPGNLIDSRPEYSWVTRVGTVVDCSVGLALVVFAPGMKNDELEKYFGALENSVSLRTKDLKMATGNSKQSRSGLDASIGQGRDGKPVTDDSMTFTTDEFAKLIVEKIGHTRIKMFAEAGTVSYNMASEVVRSLNENLIAKASWESIEEMITGDLAHEDRCRELLGFDRDADRTQNRPKYDDATVRCVIAWEPHASWLMANVMRILRDGKTDANKDRNLPFIKKYALRFKDGPDGRPEHIRFDIVMNSAVAEKEKSEILACLPKLMLHLNSVSTRLNLIDSEMEARERDLVEVLYGYFGYQSLNDLAIGSPSSFFDKHKNLLTVIGGVRYTAAIDPLFFCQSFNFTVEKRG